MLQVGLAQVTGPNTEVVVAEVIRRCRGQLGETVPQAGIVYAGGDFQHQEMLERISRQFPRAALIGCTTAGTFSSGHGFSEDSIALLLLASDRIRIRAGFGGGLSTDPRAAVTAALAMAGGVPGANSAINPGAGTAKLCLALADGLRQPFDTVLGFLNQALPSDCPLFGGCAARLEESFQPTLQFCGREVLKDALVVLIFTGPVRILAELANSWRPIGPRARITAANGPTVAQIGELKALDFYYHYLGQHPRPATNFPLAVANESGERAVMRGPVAYDLDLRTVTFTAAIPVGARVQLTEASRRFILDDTRRAAEALGDQAAGFNPDFGLVFSCFLRKEALGTRIGEELRSLAARLPARLPLLGFYGNGEIGPLVRGQPSEFHNATLVALLVGEEGEERAPAAAAAAPGPDQVAGQDGEVLCGLDGMDGLRCRINLLRTRLYRSERARRRLEDIKELHAALHHKVLEEALAARKKIRRQRTKLRESEARFRRILETTSQGFLMMDQDLVIQDCNPAYCRLLGYEREEIIGRRPIEFMDSAYQDFFIHNRDRILAQDERELESALVTRDGRTLPILIHGNTLRDADGVVQGHMAFMTDMSVHKKALLLASEVQKGLLPRAAPPLEGLDICGRSVPCDEIGGDYFDYLYGPEFPNHRFSLVVGDVIGHGIDAALLMSSARAFLRMRASQPGTLAEVVTSLNRHLSLDVLESGRFMALFYLCIGAGNRLIRWVRAGLDPALVYRPDQDEFIELMGEGTVLGLDGEAVYEENVLTPVPADAILLLATDGIWEARDIQGAMFGKARFRDMVRRHSHKSAAEIVDAVFSELDRFTLGTRPQDDRTLVVVKVRPLE